MNRALGRYDGLTVMQADLLSWLRSEAEEGHTPSYDEMRAYMGLSSKTGIHRLIGALEHRGYITRSPGLARSIKCHDHPSVRDIDTVSTADLIRELEGRGFRFYGRSAEAA